MAEEQFDAWLQGVSRRLKDTLMHECKACVGSRVVCYLLGDYAVEEMRNGGKAA